MDQRVFLRDIDDWELYARGLEAHIVSWCEQLETVAENFLDDDVGWWFAGKIEPIWVDVARVVKEAADRHERLTTHLREGQ